MRHWACTRCVEFIVGVFAVHSICTCSRAFDCGANHAPDKLHDKKHLSTILARLGQERTLPHWQIEATRPTWHLQSAFVCTVAACFGLVAGLLPSRAMSEQELAEYAARSTQGLLMSKEEENAVKAGNLFNLDNYVAKPAVPRKNLDMTGMTEDEQRKELRNRKARALEESIRVEDGWKMKMGGMPERPAKKKGRAVAGAEAGRGGAAPAGLESLS